MSRSNCGSQLEGNSRAKIFPAVESALVLVERAYYFVIAFLVGCMDSAIGRAKRCATLDVTIECRRDARW